MGSEFYEPEFECDLILKGGITSGIVYPPAIAELARHHRFRGIAGASAGAIGAAAAAAAEVGRVSDTGGFELLESLPDELSVVDEHGRTKLFRLFQAQPETRPFFDLVWKVRGEAGNARVKAVIGAVLSRSSKSLLFAIVLGGAIFGATGVIVGLVVGGAVTLGLSVPLFFVLLALAVLVALLVGFAKGATAMWSDGRAALTSNFHGFVNGSTPSDSTDPALTDWLYETLQRLAGRNDAGAENLRSAPVTYGEVAAAGAQLVCLTTNLSRGTSEQIPFREQIWAFDPEEFAVLFPADVVEHMVKQAVTEVPGSVKEALGSRLRMLPAHTDLPIIVGARMSLSFPVLLSAVPLYGLTPTQEGGAWTLKFVRNWFSDGGITSNLPVHLFDRPLPTRPTYAINLSSGADPHGLPVDNVSRPITMNQGLLPATSSISSTLGLLGAVFDTMQNWADNDLSRVAGFRERICTIRLGDGEGGMNLDMAPQRITPLVDRGRCAGRNLASMRTSDLTDTGIDASPEATRQWDRHRWTRYRIAGTGIAELIDDIEPAYHAPATMSELSYPDLGHEATQSTSPLPYDDDWTQARNDDAAAAWQAILGLGGHSSDCFGEGPAGVGLSFGADTAPCAVAPQPPRPHVGTTTP